MALIDTEGFGMSSAMADFFGAGAWSQVGSAVLPIKTGGPFGDNFVGPQVAGIRRAVPSSPSSFILGFRCAPMNNYPNYIYFRDGSGLLQCWFGTSVTGQISIMNASGGVVIAGPTAPGTVPGSANAFLLPLTILSWCYIEIALTISSTVGAVAVRVNGNTVLTATNINTNSGSASALTGCIDFGDSSGTYGSFNGLAHMYLCDTTGAAPWNSFLGDVRVQTLLPTADDAVAFAPTGLADNYLNAALVPPVPGTDYNASSTVSAQDTFAMGAVSTARNSVLGVTVKALLGKSDAGARSGATVIKSGGTTVAGTSTALSTTPQQLRKVHQIDPGTGIAWTAAGFNGMKAGYKVTA